MKKSIVVLAAFLTSWAASAQGPVLVYPNEAAVKEARPWFGTPTREGVLITAQQALESQVKPLIGTSEGKLFHSVLIRLDNEINTALFRLGEAVEDNELIASHLANVHRVEKSMKVESAEDVETLYGEAGSQAAGKTKGSDELFTIKINGKSLAEGPIRLEKKRKRSEFELTIANATDTPVWRFNLRVESEPALSFWKKGRRKGLNDIPRHVFKYQYQVFFSPLQGEKSVTLPIDVLFIKESSYLLKIEIKSKEGMVMRTVPVHFYENK